MPWNDTQRRSRTPMAAILSSKPAPLSGRFTQTPTRSSRRSPRTLKAASVRMIHCLEAGDIGPHVGLPSLEVEHHIGHPLAGAVIGELPAAPGGKQRETGIEQVAGLPLVPDV